MDQQRSSSLYPLGGALAVFDVDLTLLTSYFATFKVGPPPHDQATYSQELVDNRIVHSLGRCAFALSLPLTRSLYLFRSRFVRADRCCVVSEFPFSCMT